MKAFLSYQMSSARSSAIATELKEFLAAWGVDLYVAGPDAELRSPGDEWCDKLEEAQFFFQLYTDHVPEGVMVQEFNAWVQRSEDRNLPGPCILHLEETPIHGRRYRSLWLKGEVTRVCNLGSEHEVREALLPLLSRGARRPNIPAQYVRFPTFGRRDTQPLDLDRVREFIENFRDVYDKGLDAVFADREAVKRRLSDRIRRLAVENGTVRLLGFTLYRYLVDEGADSFKDAIRNGAHVKALQLNPQSQAAKHRAKIESPTSKFGDSKFKRDGDRVRERYKGRKRVQLKKYDHPYVGMVLFDDQAFVELYHVGKQIADTTLCGAVPILVLRKKSDEGSLYDVFHQHFENLWRESTRPTSRGRVRRSQKVQQLRGRRSA